MVLDSGGNLFDSLCLATLAALHDTKIPNIKVDTLQGGGEEGNIAHGIPFFLKGKKKKKKKFHKEEKSEKEENKSKSSLPFSPPLFHFIRFSVFYFLFVFLINERNRNRS